jgi:hypothetical protein
MSYGTSSPFGLLPQKFITSATGNYQLTRYLLASGYNTNLYKGDPAYVTTGGTIVIATAGDAHPLIGAIQGFKYFDSKNNFVESPTWVAGTVVGSQGKGSDGNLYAEVYVWDDPHQIFEIQTNATPGVALADVFGNANLISSVPAAGSVLSGWMLNQASIANANPTYQLKILSLTPTVYNGSGIGYNVVNVKINNHFLNSGTGTGGVHT